MLAGPPGGLVRGGLGALGAALAAAATGVGATLACGTEATGIRRRRGRVAAVECADGSEIAARAVISTLDFKRTFLTLFPWSDLPKDVVERVGAFRPAPGVARLLLALEAPPAVKDPSRLRRPIMPAVDADAALTAWMGGIIPEYPPATLRLVTAVDPLLAPEGGAVLTVTLGAIPYAPFDGPWDGAKRRLLMTRALALVEAVLPGTVAKIKAAELLLPHDIETALGLTDGDLCGGALTPGQMLSFRPFPECRGTRTPVEGLYLAGPSSALGPLATCASGIAAATAVLADLGAGRL
jgi:phytoene dehydrogenase-like protein